MYFNKLNVFGPRQNLLKLREETGARFTKNTKCYL